MQMADDEYPSLRSGRRCPGGWSLAAGLVLFAGSALSAQPVPPVRTVERGAPRFEMTVERGLLLGAREGEGELGAVPWMACAGPSGPFYAATMSRQGRLIHFRGDGAVAGAFGRGGRGPGEFQSVYPVEFSNGRLFAFDGATRRLTVLTPDLRVERMIPLPGPPGKAAVLAGDSILLTAEINTAELIGLPLHLVDTAGRLVRSFGAVAPAHRPDQPYRATRRVAPAGAGGVWSAHFTRYQIERWSTAGALLEQFTIPAPWFTAWDTPIDGVSQPTVVDIQEDGEGLLWVLIRVPRDGAPPPGRGVDEAARFDTVIEVIDPRAARVVASRRVNAVLREFACERTTYQYEVDPDGFTFVAVLNLALRR